MASLAEPVARLVSLAKYYLNQCDELILTIFVFNVQR